MYIIRLSSHSVRLGIPLDAFFHHRIELFAPQLLFTELHNNKSEIIDKSKLNREQFDWLYTILRNNIIIVPEEDFLNFKDKAKIICPDTKDIVYFALALYLSCPIWTNEKKLKEQKEIKVYATHDLIFMLNI
ncbi:MAG: hypothetical protein KKF44_03990 [Nanoarchaeota archaeon]|nr:hypothetical protein [Nanoarchaeota archaeon]